MLESLDLMAGLAALVPPPRMHLTRYHGVFGPHSRLRAAITPAGRGARGRGAKQAAEAPAVPKHVAMSWAPRLKRVFARILAHRQRGGTEGGFGGSAGRINPAPGLIGPVAKAGIDTRRAVAQWAIAVRCRK